MSTPIPEPTFTATAFPQFDGERAYQDVVAQVEFGPRTPGSQGHKNVVQWIVENLQSSQWVVEVKEFPINGSVIKNIVGKKGQGGTWVLLGAHYDTRIFADEDPIEEKRQSPVPGANDGASGVSVLLELARVIPDDLPGEVWIVFFDAEDNGEIAAWDWIMGSRIFVSELQDHPDAVVILDMIGDSDLNIYREKNSDPMLTQEIWRVADELGYADRFITASRYRIIDDHLPFIEAGIPAVDIIDIDYPYWHTTEDTVDKVSSESLQTVGNVVMTWLLTKLSAKTVP